MERLFAANKTPLNKVMEMPSNETIKQGATAAAISNQMPFFCQIFASFFAD